MPFCSPGQIWHPRSCKAVSSYLPLGELELVDVAALSLQTGLILEGLPDDAGSDREVLVVTIDHRQRRNPMDLTGFGTYDKPAAFQAATILSGLRGVVRGVR